MAQDLDGQHAASPLLSSCPYIMALIDSKVPSPLELTQSHPMWVIYEHMYFDVPEVQTTRPIPVQSTAGSALRREMSE